MSLHPVAAMMFIPAVARTSLVLRDYVVNTGNGEYALKTNRALWETVNHLRTRLNLNFVYEKRMLLPANVFGDQIGNTVRMDFQQFTYQLDTRYFVNPNEKNNNSK